MIAVVIDKLRHKMKYAKPDHPYHLALQVGLERLYGFLRINGEIDKTVHVICEAKGQKEDNELVLAFRRVSAEENRTNREYPFSIVIADKKTNSEGFQLVDLIARPVGLSHLKPNQPIARMKYCKTSSIRRLSPIAGNGRKVFA